jgi:hypothetical protein
MRGLSLRVLLIGPGWAEGYHDVEIDGVCSRRLA